eukprot:7389373-Prymnesium_polylepis.1
MSKHHAKREAFITADDPVAPVVRSARTLAVREQWKKALVGVAKFQPEQGGSRANGQPNQGFPSPPAKRVIYRPTRGRRVARSRGRGPCGPLLTVAATLVLGLVAVSRTRPDCAGTCAIAPRGAAGLASLSPDAASEQHGRSYSDGSSPH